MTRQIGRDLGANGAHMHDDRYTPLDFVDDHLDDLLAFFRCHEEALAGTARQVKPMNSLVEQEADSIALSRLIEVALLVEGSDQCRDDSDKIFG